MRTVFNKHDRTAGFVFGEPGEEWREMWAACRHERWWAFDKYGQSVEGRGVMTFMHAAKVPGMVYIQCEACQRAFTRGALAVRVREFGWGGAAVREI